MIQKHEALLKALQDFSITNVTMDSRTATPNSAFFIEGNNQNYINQAIEKGAKLIITDDESATSDLPIILVKNVRIALTAAAKFLYPNKLKFITSVTGTNGKTSVVHYFAQITALLGYTSASLGTMGLQVSHKKIESALKNLAPELTTPDIISMYKIMAKLSENKVDCLAFEASSHGLDQKRIYGIKVAAAGFTSLSHDHLDYHKTYEDYRSAKLKLFTENLNINGVAVLNSDIKDFEYIRNHILRHQRKVITVGTNGDVKITSITPNITGQEISFSYKNENYSFKTNILGSFQATNLLIAAILVQYSAQIEFDKIVPELSKISAAKGRLEKINNNDYHIFVDFAHTPDALEKSITELKNLTTGKLITLFGCGGDRDKTKRPIMGQIASALSDLVIITDDNPRTEMAEQIRQDIASNATNEVQIAGREEAIKYAIEKMQKGDILLIAGKGHEDYQIIGKTKYPFDDSEVARKYLTRKI